MYVCLSDEYRRLNYPADWAQTAYRCQVGPADSFRLGPITTGRELAPLPWCWPCVLAAGDHLHVIYLAVSSIVKGVDHCECQGCRVFATVVAAASQ